VTTDLVCVANVPPERMRWLWPGRIPRGKLTVLDGDPGVGKSTITSTITAKVSTGSPFPDGTRPDPADVILLSAEDEIGDTIRPQLEAAGADLARVFVLPDVREEGEPPRPPRAPPRPRPAGGDGEGPGGGPGGNRPADGVLVRGDRRPPRPGRPPGAGVHGLHGGQDRRRGADRAPHEQVRWHQPAVSGWGSIGIVGAARAGLLAAPDPDDDARRILAVTKSNLAAMPEALAYRLVEDERYGVARVVWDGATSHKAADLLQQPIREDDGEAPAREEGEAFLRELLGKGPVPAKQVKAEDREAGIAERTLDRARQAIGARTRRDGFGPGGRYVWELAMDATYAMDATSARDGEHGAHDEHGGLFDPGDPARWTR
jgi:AAA domain